MINNRSHRKITLACLGLLPGLAAFAGPAADKTVPNEPDADVVKMERFQVWSDSKLFGDGLVAPEEQFGFLGDLNVMDAPFSASRYTSDLIENQHARTLRDVLINDPSSRPAYGYGNVEELFSIRGFVLYNSDISYAGLYGALPRQVTATEMIDSVEIFKGPTALVNGVPIGGSGIGGTVNIRPKRAAAQPLTRLTLDYSNDGFVGGHIDLGRRFGAKQQFGARLNGVYRDGETAIEDEHREQGLFSLALDYTTDRVRLALDLAYQNHRIDQGRNMVLIAMPAGRILEAPDGSENYAQDWNYSYLESYFGMMSAEVILTDWLTAYAGAGGSTNDEHGIYSSPTVTNGDGDATFGAMEVPYKDNNYGYQFGLRGAFETGAIRHKLTLGYSAAHMKKRAAYAMGGFGAVTNIYRPARLAKPALTLVGGNMDHPSVTGETTSGGISLGDVMTFLDERVTVIGGVRYQKIRVSGFDYNDGSLTSYYNKDAFTPGGGIVVKPWKNISLYGNYMQALQQAPTPPATAANRDQVFAPSRAEQYEFGAKADFGAFLATLAFFQITQPSGTTDPVTTIFSLDGEQRNRGIELTAIGEVLAGVRVLGGAMLMDATLRKTDGGANDGNDAPGAPDFSLNLGAEWDAAFAKGLTFALRGIYTSKQYVDAAGAYEVPDWIRWDLSARYKTALAGVPVTFRVNVDNVFDERYWSSAAAGYASIGNPRTFLVSMTLDF
jgi:iron complex outermembrane receptor protein